MFVRYPALAALALICTGCSDPAPALEDAGGGDASSTDDTATSDDGAVSGAWAETVAGPAGVFFVTSLGDRLLAVGNLSTQPTAQSWEYAAGTWTNKTAGAQPPNFAKAMAGKRGAFDGRDGKALLLGGETSTGCVSESWSYDGGSWTKSAAPSGAQGFKGTRLALVANGALAIGGENCTGGGLLTGWRWTESGGWTGAAVEGCVSPVPGDALYQGGPIHPESPTSTDVLLIDKGDTWRWNGATCELAQSGGPSMDPYAWMTHDGKTLYLMALDGLYEWSGGWKLLGKSPCGYGMGGGALGEGHLAILCSAGGSGTKTYEWSRAR